MSIKRGVWLACSILAVIVIAFAYKPLTGFYELSTFYDPDKITENFRTSVQKFPHSIIKTGKPWHFQRAAISSLPDTYHYAGQEQSLQDLLVRTGTTGLLIAKDDTILFERYYQGEADTDRHSMFSVTKSFVSALVGIAIEQGLIQDIDDPINQYVPALNGSAYAGTRIRDILTMSSGVSFNEDYGDLFSDVNRMSMTIATGGSLDAFALSLDREREPGQYNNYVSVDTHVLGMLLVAVTGKSLSEYLEQNLWIPLGMEHEGIWAIDGEGMEVAMGGLQVSLRDMARLGRLYLHEGNWNGHQLIPAQWIRDSTTPSAPHLRAGFNNPGSATPYGYGFQWWTPSNPHGDFVASGIYQQFIYVDPTTGIVISKTSAHKGFTKPENILDKDEAITAFQDLSAALGDPNWQDTVVPK